MSHTNGACCRSCAKILEVNSRLFDLQFTTSGCVVLSQLSPFRKLSVIRRGFHSNSGWFSHPQWWISERKHSITGWMRPIHGALSSQHFLFLPCCLRDGWNFLPDLWTLTDSTRVFPWSVALSPFAQQCELSPWPFGALRPMSRCRTSMSFSATIAGSAFLWAFHRHCSEVIAQVKPPGKYLSAHWCFWGALWARLRPLPVAGSAPQGGDSSTKQLGSVVTPLLAPLPAWKKSLWFTSTQPLSFPSCWCPAFPERRDKTPSFTYRHSPRGLPALASSGDVS